MSPDALRLAIAALRIKPAAAGRFLGVSDRTMRRYLRGERDVPAATVLLLNCMITHRLRPLVPPRRP
jgi:hypothetical protein